MNGLLTKRGRATRRVVCMDDLRDRSFPEPNTGCLLWGGYLNKGYLGVAGPNRKPLKGHRLAWEFTHGAIPAGLFVCHSCDTPICLNPDHLFLGTANDNVQDRNRKGRTRGRNPTHCKRGHEFTSDNTRQTVDGRACRTCDRMRDRGCL